MYYAGVWPLNLVLSMTKGAISPGNDFSCTCLLLLLLLQRTGTAGAGCFVFECTGVHMNDNLHCSGIAQG